MDSKKLGGLPLSATQQTPSPAKVYPKVYLSTSPGCSSSLPIRAPPTVDSDFELSISTNGYINSNSSCSSSDSGFESEEFLSGEEGFETASERPFVPDPDDGTLEQSSTVDDDIVSRPFLSHPFGEIKEGSSLFEETDEEEDECPAIRKLGVPIAILSRDSDDDSAGTEELEDDDGFLGAVRVPGFHVLEKSDSGIKLKHFGVEEGEEEESLFESAFEADVIKDSDTVLQDVLGSSEGSVTGMDSVNGSVLAELVKDKGIDDADEKQEESFVANVNGKQEIKEDSLYLVGEIQGPEHTEQQECLLKEDATTQMHLVIDSEEDKALVELNEIIASRIGEAGALNDGIKGTDMRDFKENDGGKIECLLKEDATTQMHLVIDSEEDKALVELNEIIASRIGEAGALNDGIKGTDMRDFKENDGGKIDGKTNFNVEGSQLLEEKEVLVSGSDPTNCSSDENIDSKLLESDATATQVAEHNLASAIMEANMQEMEFYFSKEGENVNLNRELTVVYQNSESNNVQVVGESQNNNGWGSNDEILLECTKDHIIELGDELHDNVARSCIEPVDSCTLGNVILSTDSTRFSEPYPAQETKYLGNGHSPGITEGSVIEDGMCSTSNTVDPLYVESNLDPEVKEEPEDEASHVHNNAEESSFSEDDSKGLIVKVPDGTELIMDDLEKSLSHTSLGESSQDLFQGSKKPIFGDSDVEVDTARENEGQELFDSDVWADLLKAAAGAKSGGDSFTITSANGSTVFSLDPPADSSTSLNSFRHSLQPYSPILFTAPKIMDKSRGEAEEKSSEEENNQFEKIQLIRVKFFRLVQRLGLSSEDAIAAQVLYRLALAAGRPSSQVFSLEWAKKTAMQLEAEGKIDLDISLNILVLGKTGVGKSATINSIFGEKKAIIDAFEPATTSVREVVGKIDGIGIRIFDTPGLRSSLMDQAFNRKVLLSIKRVTKQCPPDIVLYVDRLDTQATDLNDLPLLRSITSLLGSSIWDNVIVTLTHAACNPPDGPTGSPLSFDLFVAHRSRVIQQLISQAASGSHVMSPTVITPVSLVENHSSCQQSEDGQILLPNGESWRPQLLLLCYSMKILSEANSMSKSPDLLGLRNLFGIRPRSPPLPYFLSLLLQANAHPKLPAEQGGDNIDSNTELGDFSDCDQDEDEYDQLPPFKPLHRSQIAKLSKEQKRAYFEEYDYRVKLLQKKQWKEEVRRLKELKKSGKGSSNIYNYMEEVGDTESGSSATVAVPLPDMVLPPSFDGDQHAYRYRSLEAPSPFLARPVLDAQGWDHDCGYDGVSLESSLSIAGYLPAVVAVQITKDKEDFNIHLDSSVAAKLGEYNSTMAGLDILTVGKQLAYVLKGETKMKNHKSSKMAAGVSLALLGENVAGGLKLEDQIVVGKRLVLTGSAGNIRSQGDNAYGANLELRLREKNLPIGQDQTTLSLSLMRWRGDLIWIGNMQSQFSVGRSSKVVVQAELNNKLSGRVSVRTSSSDQLQIALLGILPIANTVCRRIFPGFSEKYLPQ